MDKFAEAGQWVQIHTVVLKPGERAPQVPADTQQVPLEMWVKGFALHNGEIGSPMQVKTLTGRVESGMLVSVLPSYPHGFGKPVPELMAIGQELRKMLSGEADK